MFLWDFLQNFSQSFSNRFFRQPQQRKRAAFFFTGLCVFALAAPQIAPVSAQSTQATVQEILDGNQVFIQNRQASIKDVARQQQQVRTGKSRTALLFNTGAVARLSANSVLRIGQCARLQRGTILINGAVNACSSGITTGVRGTTYLLEVDDLGNQQVKVLEGEVVVKRNATPLLDEEDEPTNKPTTNTKPSTTKPSTKNPNLSSPSAPSKIKQFNLPSTINPQINLPQEDPQKPRPLEPLNTEPANTNPILRVEDPSTSNQTDEVVLKAGEKLEVDRQGVLGIIQQLTENEFVELLQGGLFQGFTNQIPGLGKIRDVFKGLFPSGSFPISIPGIPTPNIPIPNLPRFPF